PARSRHGRGADPRPAGTRPGLVAGAGMSASAQPQNSSAGTRHPLRLAVVGHTNTGKTSLLRTLARDPAFGQVSDSPGTTRDVRGVQLLLQGRPAIELFDTPGLEDGMGLLDYLDQIAA